MAILDNARNGTHAGDPMPRVLISDKLEASGLDILKQAGLDVDNRPGLTAAALQQALQAADGVIVRSGTKITAELLDNPGKLRAIVRAGVGVDNIDVPAATRKGIVVMNTPGGNTSSAPRRFARRAMPTRRGSTRIRKGSPCPSWCRRRAMGKSSRFSSES
jgi:D-3-phosphoglycerate dehydrogenase